MAKYVKSAFTVQPLSSKPATFFADAKAGFSLVEGAGQTLYWKNCYVLVFRTGENKTPIAKHEVGDGQAVLPVGLDAFLGGPAGKFKAMSAREVEEEEKKKKKKEEEKEDEEEKKEEKRGEEKRKEKGIEEKDEKEKEMKEAEEDDKGEQGSAKDEGERKAVRKRKVCCACKGKGYIVEEP